jgi:murein DD-endopeptidase MepM/ murein hydrolase activator NlpD
LPDLRQPLRHIAASRLVGRISAHVMVIALLLGSAAFGVATTRSPASTSHADSAGEPAFAIVSTARGAAEGGTPGRTSSFDLQADPLHNDPMLSRKAVPTFPPTPAATPVSPPPVTPEPANTIAAPQVGAATAARGGKLLWPLPGGVITQYYHAGHLALDIAAPAGTRVNAAEGGVVVWAGWRNNGGGYVISINHGNGMTTVYNHLGSIWVSPGQYVSAGQGIGGVGCTGMCTGPHVHFEVIVNGVIDNPLRYL